MAASLEVPALAASLEVPALAASLEVPALAASLEAAFLEAPACCLEFSDLRARSRCGSLRLAAAAWSFSSPLTAWTIPCSAGSRLRSRTSLTRASMSSICFCASGLAILKLRRSSSIRRIRADSPSSRPLNRPVICRWIIDALFRSSRSGCFSRSVWERVRAAFATGVIACFCIVSTRASSSRSSRRASSNWRAASSLETIRSRISRLLPTFGPLIASKSRASAKNVMTDPGVSLSGASSQVWVNSRCFSSNEAFGTGP